MFNTNTTKSCTVAEQLKTLGSIPFLYLMGSSDWLEANTNDLSNSWNSNNFPSTLSLVDECSKESTAQNCHPQGECNEGHSICNYKGYISFLFLPHTTDCFL